MNMTDTERASVARRIRELDEDIALHSAELKSLHTRGFRTGSQYAKHGIRERSRRLSALVLTLTRDRNELEGALKVSGRVQCAS